MTISASHVADYFIIENGQNDAPFRNSASKNGRLRSSSRFQLSDRAGADRRGIGIGRIQHTAKHQLTRICTPLCRLCGRLDDLISEPTRAVGATVTVGTVILACREWPGSDHIVCRRVYKHRAQLQQSYHSHHKQMRYRGHTRGHRVPTAH